MALFSGRDDDAPAWESSFEIPLDLDHLRGLNATREEFDAAWVALVDRYALPLEARLLRMGLPPDDVEDILERTWTKALLRIGSFGEGNLGGWLGRIAERIALDHMRSERRRRAHNLPGFLPVTRSPEAQILSRIMLRRVQASLTLKEQRLLQMWADGFPHCEIAEELEFKSTRVSTTRRNQILTKIRRKYPRP